MESGESEGVSGGKSGLRAEVPMNQRKKSPLATQYLGLRLTSPLVVSSCPLTSDVETLRALEEAGAAAAVLPSILEEQIDASRGSPDASSDYALPELDHYNLGPEAYLQFIADAKQVTSMPLIASLNGVTSGHWTEYASRVEDAGADALELNIYFVATDPTVSGVTVDQLYVELVRSIRQRVSIPLTVKIGPFFSSLAHLARQLVEAGVDGLVLFNRYLEPDVDIHSLTVDPRIVLSTRHELWLPLRWIAILRSDLPQLSLAATSGVHFAEDLIKALLVGADVAMVASVVMRYGPNCLGKLLEQVQRWMEYKGFEKIEDFRGLMRREHWPQGAVERANYMQALSLFADKGESSGSV